MTHDMADKTTHVDIVQNPDIKNFLDECNYMVPPTGNELAEITSNFISVPSWDKELPTKIIANKTSNRFLFMLILLIISGIAPL